MVERGTTATFDQQVRKADNSDVSFDVVFDTFPIKSTQTMVAGPGNLNAVDLVTGDARKGGAGGILSVTDKYTVTPEPATGIAAVLLVGATAFAGRDGSLNRSERPLVELEACPITSVFGQPNRTISGATVSST